MSILLHGLVFAIIWFFRVELGAWVPSPTVYQVELVGLAQSAPAEITAAPVAAPAPVTTPETVTEKEESPEEPAPKYETPQPKKSPKEEKKPESPRNSDKPKSKPEQKQPVVSPPAPDPSGQPGGKGGTTTGAATGDSTVTGSNRMNIEIPNFPFAYYLNILKFRIQENWRPPPGRRQRETAVVKFVISRQGKISNIVLVKGSGKHHFDQAAQRAVHYADPLPPLPPDFLEDFLTVHIEFEGL